MADSGINVSVSKTGGSYDNVLTGTVKGLYKSEVIEYIKENWYGVNSVELVTLEWVG